MSYNKAANWPAFKSINCRRHRMSPGIPTRTSLPARAPQINEHSSISNMSISTPALMLTARNESPIQLTSDPSM